MVRYRYSDGRIESVQTMFPFLLLYGSFLSDNVQCIVGG
jgi:hypothetical protein